MPHAAPPCPATPAAAAPASPTEPDLLTPGRCLAVLAALVLLAHADVLFGQRSFFYRDFGSFGLPLAHHHRESFWRGEVPLWNPLSNCGLPFLAQWNTLTLYPFSLIYLLGPLPWALNLFMLFHQWLAGAGAFWLARRWTGDSVAAALAGIAWAFGGLMLNSLAWPNNLAALALLPWLLLATDRVWHGARFAVPQAALVGATQMLTGAPEIIALSWTIVGTLWLGHRWHAGRDAWAGWGRHTLRFAGVVALVTGLAAAQLLPFLELVTLSHRDAAYGNSIWSLSVAGWGHFLVPLFQGFPWTHGVWFQRDQFWSTSLYAGGAVLVLAALALCPAKRQRAATLAALAGLGLLLALGDDSPVLAWCKGLLPLLGYVRFPVKFAVLACVLLPLLAALGVAAFRRGELSARPLLVSAVVALSLIVGLVVLDRLTARYPGSAEVRWSIVASNGAVRAVFLAALVGVIAATRSAASARRRAWLGVAAPLLLWGDLMTHMPTQNPTTASWAFQSLAGAAAQPPPVRLGAGRALPLPAAERKIHDASLPQSEAECLLKRLSLYWNANLLENLPRVGGTWSLELQSLAQLERSLATRPPAAHPGLLDFLGVTHLSSVAAPSEWTPRPSARPLITAGQVPVFTNQAGALAALGAPEFAPGAVVFLPVEAQAQVPATATTARVSQVRWAAQEITFQTEAEAAALVVIAQAWYPHWRAVVDDQPTALWRANGAFQALVVPAGPHTVRLRYADSRFRLGVGISLLTLALVAGWFRWERRQPVAASELRGAS